MCVSTNELPPTAHTMSLLGWQSAGRLPPAGFFGFKLLLVINDRVELLHLALTPGNVDDRKPVPKLVQGLFGKLFGGKGYISQPLQELLRQSVGVLFLTKLKSNSNSKTVFLWLSWIAFFSANELSLKR